MGEESSQIQSLVEWKSLPKEIVEKAKDVAKGIQITDSQAVIQYATGIQVKISQFADTILNEIRAKDAGQVGTTMTNLLLKIKDINVGDLGSDNFLSKIPIIGAFVDSVKKFIARYEKLSVQIEKIISELDKARMDLLRDITMLDGLFQKNQEYLNELDIFIAAGAMKLEELKTTELPKLEELAKTTKDPKDAQRLHDFTQLLNRFEKKLHDLKLSRMIAIQTAPQIRLIQNNNQVLVEKIQSSILNTIPLWKNQIVIAISLFRQEKALNLQKEVNKTTNDLLTKNSEMLKNSSLEVARESERGIVEIETLKKVNNDLISTIEETLKIQAEGRAKRREAEQELLKMESELKAKLQEIKSEP